MKKVNKSFLVIISIVVILLATACNKEEVNEENNREENNEVENDNNERMENEVLEEENNENEEEEIELYDEVEFSVSENEAEIGKFTVDLTAPESEYELDNGVEIVLAEYFPDFIFVDGEPHSQSDYPLNPAFIFLISKEDETDIAFVAIGQNLAAEEDARFTIDIVDYVLHQE